MCARIGRTLMALAMLVVISSCGDTTSPRVATKPQLLESNGCWGEHCAPKELSPVQIDAILNGLFAMVNDNDFCNDLRDRAMASLLGGWTQSYMGTIDDPDFGDFHPDDNEIIDGYDGYTHLNERKAPTYPDPQTGMVPRETINTIIHEAFHDDTPGTTLNEEEVAESVGYFCTTPESAAALGSRRR